MASSSSSAFHPLKYDVFLNFRGEDTRRGFTSHLYAALRRKALQTFFDDDGLKRGEEIAQSLPRAIQDSTVAILVFSKDYASSRWCLDELAEIIECHHSHGQIVIPVFYQVDPSHLRKQSDDVAAAFVKHEQNPINIHKIPRWKDALTKAASLSGFDSKEFRYVLGCMVIPSKGGRLLFIHLNLCFIIYRNDDLLINKIVEKILEKLNQSMPCDDFEHLKLFTINPFKARILGIWGMGGIGKTTAAEVIYKMMSCQFQDCCFVYNVKQQAEASGINKLREELILKVLGEKDSVKYTFNASPDLFLKRILGRKKVLIVLDDVNNSLQLESLIGDPYWFGSGSMILVTSRDKQVFERRADFIYKVKLLNDDEALQLFNKMAFKQNYPRDDYASLSKSIVKYAQGNPLALKVLGSALNGKNHEEWKSALTQLSKVQNKDILQVLQISYSGLTREDSLLSQVKYRIVDSFRRLTSLSLVQNRSITHLPNGKNVFLEALEVLNLWGCSNLKTFPKISINIKRLNLDLYNSEVFYMLSVDKEHMRDCFKGMNFISTQFDPRYNSAKMNINFFINVIIHKVLI
ncbi:hypothetical protein K2173_014405 [Erythroxylum novogranatense]|uniref:ADP-ribosyl cyclase/cyclic ADP-ribose hydrolase n=1 Tax=Erythroxylum novogranatense TaxID=1862640 RepID=A0AAV8S577_9ROSI|nr:hypothetical protein K2173_014405 [Erythroxylum novogranatense]